MKSIFRYIIFLALSASAVLASCSKEPAVEGNPGTSEENQGLRTIILQFSPGTKAIVGVKSSFVNGDVIKLSNATQSEDATVQVVNGVASITTALTGNLTAVYPSTAANVTGTNPIGTPAYKVPSVQDGTLENAVIAVANITDPSAVFEFQPALFQITPPSTAKQIIIKSLAPVESGVARTGTAVEINTDGTDKTAITVGDGSADLPGTIYVALVPGVKLTDLSFDAGETVGMKGIPESTVTSRATASGKTFDDLNVVALGNAYQIDNNNWHPYVTIGGKKWATRNIGATADTGADSYGTYFTFGSVEKVYTSLSGTTFTFQTENPDPTKYSPFRWNSSRGFVEYNAPYLFNHDPAHAKYTGPRPSGDGKSVLDLADDAAYAYWGGPWRMPTGGTESNADFTALANVCRPGYSSGIFAPTVITKDPTSQGVYFYNVSGNIGAYFVYSSQKKLFFPAAGYGAERELNDPDFGCSYWSSSVPSDAYYVLFIRNTFYPQNPGNRHHGFSVRPVSD